MSVNHSQRITVQSSSKYQHVYYLPTPNQILGGGSMSNNLTKKDLIFNPVMLLIASLMFLLNTTGMIVHIVLSIVGVLVLVIYTYETKDEWKVPALEILMRAVYGVALITGIIVYAAHIPALGIIHKLCGTLFIILLAVLIVMKIIDSRKG